MTTEDLLAQVPRIRALALALLRNPHDADDAVQETMARAAAHRPRHPGWLVTVVRNVVASMQRSKGRVRAREREAARPEATPPTAKLVERAEWHRRVVSALLALSAPDRDVLLMRYFDDLGPKEIARRLRQPAGTVRSRLKRALDKLRAQFDAHHGSRTAWLAPLAAVVRRRSLVPAALVVAAVLVLVAFVGWGVAGRGGPGKHVPQRVSDTQRSDSSEPKMDKKPDPSVAETAAVVGYVRDWKGQPVTGATVRALVGGLVVAETKSGAGGAFTMRVDPSERADYIATAPGYAPGFPGAGLILRLQPIVPFFGTVVDEKDQPIAGARVSLWRHAKWRYVSARTNEQGEVGFEGIGPALWNLRVEADGFTSWSDHRLASNHPFRVRLSRGRAFRGALRDPTGQPLAGVAVTLSLAETWRPWSRTAVTDSGGRFEFRHVSSAESLALAVGGHVLIRNLRIDASPEDFVIVVNPKSVPADPAAPGTMVSGRVVDARGAGIAGVAVNGRYSGSDGAFRARAVTGKFAVYREGFEFTWAPAKDGVVITMKALPEGRPYSGRVLSHDHRPVPGAFVELSSRNAHAVAFTDASGNWSARYSGKSATIRIRARGHASLEQATTGETVLPKANTVVAVFVGTNGQPVPGVNATLGASSFSNSRYIYNKSRFSDATGRIVWEGVPSGTCTISVGRPKMRRDIEVPVSDPIRIEVPIAGSITGVVQDADGRPVRAGVSVLGGGVTYARTDFAGRFRLPYVGPGTHTLVARAEGELIVKPLEGVRAGGHVVLRARDGGVIVGRIVDKSQQPIAGVDVQLKTIGRIIETDTDGRFRFGGLRPGRYTLKMSAFEYWADPVEGLKSDGGLRTFVMRRTLTITGHVVGDGIVRVSAAGPSSGPDGDVQDDGSFEIRGLKPGRYGLMLWREGQTSARSVKNNVPAGATGIVLTPRQR